MVNMTLSIPQELHRIMKKYTYIKWSEVARQAMWQRAKDLELLDKLTAKSTLTMKDVEELDKTIKEGIAKRHRAEG